MGSVNGLSVALCGLLLPQEPLGRHDTWSDTYGYGFSHFAAQAQLPRSEVKYTNGEGMTPHNFAARPPPEPRKLNTPGMNTDAFSSHWAYYGDCAYHLLLL